MGGNSPEDKVGGVPAGRGADPITIESLYMALRDFVDRRDEPGHDVL
jgi:hypothetical protein